MTPPGYRRARCMRCEHELDIHKDSQYCDPCLREIAVQATRPANPSSNPQGQVFPTQIQGIPPQGAYGFPNQGLPYPAVYGTQTPGLMYPYVYSAPPPIMPYQGVWGVPNPGYPMQPPYGVPYQGVPYQGMYAAPGQFVPSHITPGQITAGQTSPVKGSTATSTSVNQPRHKKSYGEVESEEEASERSSKKYSQRGKAILGPKGQATQEPKKGQAIQEPKKRQATQEPKKGQATPGPKGKATQEPKQTDPPSKRTDKRTGPRGDFQVDFTGSWASKCHAADTMSKDIAENYLRSRNSEGRCRIKFLSDFYARSALVAHLIPETDAEYEEHKEKVQMTCKAKAMRVAEETARKEALGIFSDALDHVIGQGRSSINTQKRRLQHIVCTLFSAVQQEVRDLMAQENETLRDNEMPPMDQHNENRALRLRMRSKVADANEIIKTDYDDFIRSFTKWRRSEIGHLKEKARRLKIPEQVGEYLVGLMIAPDLQTEDVDIPWLSIDNHGWRERESEDLLAEANRMEKSRKGKQKERPENSHRPNTSRRGKGIAEVENEEERSVLQDQGYSNTLGDNEQPNASETEVAAESSADPSRAILSLRDAMRQARLYSSSIESSVVVGGWSFESYRRLKVLRQANIMEMRELCQMCEGFLHDLENWSPSSP